MKQLFLFLLFTYPLILYAQSVSNAQTSHTSAIITTSQLTAEAASLQLRNWEAAVMRDPNNAEAWYNYYIWMERNPDIRSGNKEKRLSQVLKDAGNHIQHQAAYHLMRYLQSQKKDTASLMKAVSLKGNADITYPYLVQYQVMNNDKASLQATCRLIESARPMTPSSYKYHFNVLMSADSNAVIYSKGLNDLVPMAVLQQVYHIRNDIRLVSYQDGMEIKPGSYLCLSMGASFLSRYPDASCTGLLVKLSKTPAFEELKKNVEDRFDLDSLQFNSPDPGTVQLQKNYLPGFILLYRYYVKMNNPRQHSLKIVIQKIAALAGVTESVYKLVKP
jgi:hypothetical protein